MLRTATFGSRAGTVTAYDSAAGLGVITAEDGAKLSFHCTQIADGTREIEVGRSVTFTIAAGHQGRFEATDIS
jgi:cold shock CspA family protein